MEKHGGRAAHEQDRSGPLTGRARRVSQVRVVKMLSSTGFALFGAALVAISYGLARFAFGLFVPPIRAELELTPYVIGIIGALPLVSFLLATLVAPLAADRLGARFAAVLSACSASSDW